MFNDEFINCFHKTVLKFRVIRKIQGLLKSWFWRWRHILAYNNWPKS